MLRASLSGSARFSITADGCTGTALGPHKSCNVTVQYAPTTAGQTTATLAANATRPSSSANITLNGTGRSTTGPGDLFLENLGSDPNPDENGTKTYFYDFGAVASATQDFAVHNRSITDTSNTLNLFLNNNSNFAVSSDSCTGQALAPGQTRVFQLTFTAPAVCNPGTLFDTAVGVFVQTNNYPYIVLSAQGSCPP